MSLLVVVTKELCNSIRVLLGDGGRVGGTGAVGEMRSGGRSSKLDIGWKRCFGWSTDGSVIMRVTILALDYGQADRGAAE